jgi:hypothetical protein
MPGRKKTPSDETFPRLVRLTTQLPEKCIITRRGALNNSESRAAKEGVAAHGRPATIIYCHRHRLFYTVGRRTHPGCLFE